MTDDWHARLLRELALASTADGCEELTALEIAFGHARTAITYAIEVARAHRIPALANVSGDDVWFQLGDERTRITLNRRDQHVIAHRPGVDTTRVRWDRNRRMAMNGDNPVDVGALARDGIDAVVAAWRARPTRDRVSGPPPRNTEDELTKS